MKRICVYCGSSPGFNPAYMEMAKKLGEVLIENQYELVYGGADVGLMGEVANAVLESGGVVHGIIPEFFADKVSHKGLNNQANSKLHIAGSMHERKEMMFNLSDAFIALPGGIGTLEELSELMTWSGLGMHSKPCGLINVDGYYDLFFSFMDNVVSQGFMKQEHRDMLLSASSPEDLLEQMIAYKAPLIDKWVGKKPVP